MTRSSSPWRRTSDLAARARALRAPRRLLLAWLVGALACAGCASPPDAAARFDAPLARTFRAVERALESEPIARADVQSGVIETGWKEVRTNRPFGHVLDEAWIERRSFTVEMEPLGAKTAVEVRVRAEARPPAGKRAIRWERVERPEYARDLVARIEEELRR